MHETPTTLARLQAIIDRSTATAGAAIRRNFIGGGWAMSAAEFVAFWDATPMAAISTASRSGAVHSAPLEVSLRDGRFLVPTYADAARLVDHVANPRCSIVGWDGPYRAVIVYGDARVSGGATAASDAGGMVSVEIEPTRIYGIRPPPGHARA